MRAAAMLVGLGLGLGCGGAAEPGPVSAPGAPTSASVAAPVTAAPAIAVTAPAADPRARALAGITADGLLADVAWLTAPALKGRGFASPEAVVAADRLERELAAAGLETVRQPIPGLPGQSNVVGVLAGDDEVVLVCAHYDGLGVVDGRVHAGADDNASGVAVLLALARAVGKTHRGRTIVFLATGGEEAGLLGAKAYVHAPVRPLGTTRAVLNFDMVGRDFLEGLGGGRERTFAVVGLESDARLDAAVRRAASAEGVALVPVAAGLLKLLGFDAYSDDFFFRNRRVPAVRFSTGEHPDYHRPTDTAERLRPGQLLGVARVAARALVELGELKVR